MKRRLLAWAALVVCLVAGTSRAGVEADPNKEYPICPEAGPWMVCVTSYVGDSAPLLAHEMVLEIRSRYGLNAYVLNKGAEEKRKQHEEAARKRAEFYSQFPDANIPVRVRVIRIEEQCAVLVGGYKDLNAAEKALKDIHKLPPPSQDKLCPILTRVRALDSKEGPQGSVIEGAPANPFMMSFVVPNPTVPREKKADNLNDPFLLKLNASEKYNLLKCKKPFTLMVAQFQGLQTVTAKADTSSFWDKLWSSSTGELLEASGHNAHNLAQALKTVIDQKKLRLDVYVLHTRHASFVSVGAFDSAEDGEVEAVKREVLKLQRGPGLALMAQPLVMAVPHP